MRFEISHVVWNATDAEIKAKGLPTDDFEFELDYELDDPYEGPTEDEFDEIDTLLREEISDAYETEVEDFGWGVIE